MSKVEDLICVRRCIADIERPRSNELYLVKEDVDDKNVLPRSLYNKLTDPTNIITRFDPVVVSRDAAEFNTYYQQLVIGIIIKCRDKLVLLECTEGDMAGNITMIQGHVEEKDNLADGDVMESVLEAAHRELHEEMIFRKEFPLELTLKFNTCNNYDLKSISFYHYGFIYEVIVPDEYYDDINEENIVSGEPEKNKVHILNLRDLEFECIRPDSWLNSILEYYSMKI